MEGDKISGLLGRVEIPDVDRCNGSNPIQFCNSNDLTFRRISVDINTGINRRFTNEVDHNQLDHSGIHHFASVWSGVCCM
jgi:hypothetical protein